MLRSITMKTFIAKFAFVQATEKWQILQSAKFWTCALFTDPNLYISKTRTPRSAQPASSAVILMDAAISAAEQEAYFSFIYQQRRCSLWIQRQACAGEGETAAFISCPIHLTPDSPDHKFARRPSTCQYSPFPTAANSSEKSFYSILFYSILFYSILFYSILFYSILS